LIISTSAVPQQCPAAGASQGPAAPPRRHIAGLDGIRAVAAGLVLLFHYWTMTGRQPLPTPLLVVVTNGGVGVDIFFVISGFILFLPWARAGWTGEQVKVRRFLRNRFLRVVPAFWFNAAVLLVISFPMWLFSFHGLKSLFLYGTFLAGWAPPRVVPTLMLNQVAWTLCIEVVFYLVLPVVARFFVRDRWKIALPVVLGATVLFKLVMISRYGHLQNSGILVGSFRNIAGMFGEFAAGMAVAAIWAKLEYRGVRLGKGLGLGLTVIGLAGIWAPLYYNQFYIGREDYLRGTGNLGWIPMLTMFPVVALFAGVAIFGICYQANVVTRFLSLRPIAYLGVISYGIYLWHLPLGGWLSRGVGAAPGSRRMLLALLVVGTAVTFAVAAFSHRFVEQPFLQRKKVAVAAAVTAPPAPDLVPVPRPAPMPVSTLRNHAEDTIRIEAPALSS
jgi:peptidoglycan/LPS O-acetylase OafA/YrhL